MNENLDQVMLKHAINEAMATNDAERVVMLPPYVEPGHRDMIEKAEVMLEDYSKHLLEKVKVDLFENGWTIDPHPADIKKAEMRFHEDRMRMYLVKQLSNIKAMCERPRFLIKPLPEPPK